MEEPRLIPKNNETGKRLFWSAIFVSMAWWVVMFAPSAVYFGVAVFFILAALNEYIALAGKKNWHLNKPLLLSLGFAAPLAMELGMEPVFWVAVVSLLFAAVSRRKEDLSQAMMPVAAGLLGIVWIAWLFSYIVDLRSIHQGRLWVFYTLLVTKTGDAGAYFVGKSWGKTPFVTHISPQKTREGAAGQLVTSILVSCFSGIYLHVPWYHLLFLGVLIGIIAQLGDMIESVVKRCFDAKDSGAIPGLGGFLDIMDSLLFSVPLVYFYVLWFQI